MALQWSNKPPPSPLQETGYRSSQTSGTGSTRSASPSILLRRSAPSCSKGYLPQAGTTLCQSCQRGRWQGWHGRKPCQEPSRSSTLRRQSSKSWTLQALLSGDRTCKAEFRKHKSTSRPLLQTRNKGSSMGTEVLRLSSKLVVRVQLYSLGSSAHHRLMTPAAQASQSVHRSMAAMLWTLLCSPLLPPTILPTSFCQRQSAYVSDC